MSPREFNKAWKARNERLEAAGVFEHLDALFEKYGDEIFWLDDPESADRGGH
jgi:hypothetical protein